MPCFAHWHTRLLLEAMLPDTGESARFAVSTDQARLAFICERGYAYGPYYGGYGPPAYSWGAPVYYGYPRYRGGPGILVARPYYPQRIYRPYARVYRGW
jgi:hypothetical protein